MSETPDTPDAVTDPEVDEVRSSQTSPETDPREAISMPPETGSDDDPGSLLNT